jgi:hypothetical protein
MVERYVGGKLHLGVGITMRGGREWYAFFKRDVLGQSDRASAVELEANPGGLRPHNQHFTVLVHDVEGVQQPEVRVPSVVWFQPDEKLNGRGATFSYYSLFHGFVKRFLVSGYWERDFLDVLSLRPRKAAMKTERKGYVVKGRPKVMNGIPGGQTYLAGKVPRELHDLVRRAVRIDLFDDAVRAIVEPQELVDGFPKITDVLVGPINL